MRITIHLSTHVYAEEKLEDDIYLDEALPDTIETCGIHGPEVVVPLRRNNHREIVFNYDKKTTLGDFEIFIKNAIHLPLEYGRIAFVLVH